MCEQKGKKALEDSGIMALKSDNIEVGGRIPLRNGKVGIVTEQAQLCSVKTK